MKTSQRKTSKAFKRKVLARWRLLSTRGWEYERAAVELGVRSEGGRERRMPERKAAGMQAWHPPLHLHDHLRLLSKSARLLPDSAAAAVTRPTGGPPPVRPWATRTPLRPAQSRYAPDGA